MHCFSVRKFETNVELVHSDAVPMRLEIDFLEKENRKWSAPSLSIQGSVEVYIEERGYLVTPTEALVTPCNDLAH